MSDQNFDSETRIGELLKESRADSFAPYFSDRVLRRLGTVAQTPEDYGAGSLYDGLKWVFVRAASACLLLIVAIGLVNAFEFGLSDTSLWVDALFGLPSAELAEMLTYDLI
jgi:hypothetical protein